MRSTLTSPTITTAEILKYLRGRVAAAYSEVNHPNKLRLQKYQMQHAEAFREVLAWLESKGGLSMELKWHEWNPHVRLVHNEIDGWVVQHDKATGVIGPQMWPVADIKDDEKREKLLALVGVGAGEEIPWGKLKDIAALASMTAKVAAGVFRESLVQEMAEAVASWDGEDIEALKDYVETLQLYSKGTTMEGHRLIDVPTAEEIPDELANYPIWAIDRHGMALVGGKALRTEHIDTLRQQYLDEETD